VLQQSKSNAVFGVNYCVFGATLCYSFRFALSSKATFAENLPISMFRLFVPWNLVDALGVRLPSNVRRDRFVQWIQTSMRRFSFEFHVTDVEVVAFNKPEKLPESG
jgi:hypothetical protein